ncbi:MAG: hypothetical protein EHM35_01405 [Planctomycetaceae bacterium]|nr:MAG: hypothetical protein EHM35_01405 [Planctomycetaceae bacterium]
MGILVIEGGCANGMDLVVGDHRFNPVAQANGAPQRQVRVLPIGEDFVIIGLSIEPTIVMEGDEQSFAAVLSVVGGRESTLVPTIPVKLVLGELARIPLAQLRERLGAVIDGATKGEPA